MRLWLVWSGRILRRFRSTSFTKDALAETASSDANRRLLSSFDAAWLLPAVQRKLLNPRTNGINEAYAVEGRWFLKLSSSPTLQFLRTFRGGREEKGKQTVDVSSEIWQLLREYDVPAIVERLYRVQIEAAQTTSKKVQLTLRGQNASHVATMLTDPPLKLNVREEVTAWLLAEGPKGRRGIDIQKSRDKKSVLLVGPSEATLAAKSLIDACCTEEFDIEDFIGFYLINNDAFHQKRLGVVTDAHVSPAPVAGAVKWKAVVVGPTESVKRLRSNLDGLHIERRQVPRAVCTWLASSSRGANSIRSTYLDLKFGTCICMGPHKDVSNPARMVDLTVVGERQESVDKVLTLIEGLHVKHRQVPQAVYHWLINTSKGAECARELELERKFDTCIDVGRPSDDDPTSAVNLTVVGEREKEWIKFLTQSDRTDTHIGRDEGAGCLRVAGRPDCVRAAVEKTNKTQHIALRTSVISFAMSNYIGRARRPYENDDRQLHLAYNDVQPGTWELRRLYVMASQGDDAKADKADEDLMRKLDLDEVVLEAPKWARFLVNKCREMEETTVTGIGFSEDAIKGRVIVAIAGSTSTVKKGMKEVIRRIEGHAQYKEGDICLRRIQGQSLDTAGFRKTGDAKPLDLSSCKEPFDWDRLTRERWRYVGAPRGGRPSKRPRQPSV